MTSERPAALVVFTRDLRIADNPALTAATRSSAVVCAFVHDDALRTGPTMHPLRSRFLSECIADLDMSLRQLGSRLEERAGSWADEVLALASETGARTIHLSDDVTPYAQRRFARLESQAGRSVEICRSPGLTIVPPGLVTPVGGDCYRVFTPYYRRWLSVERRAVLPPPSSLVADSWSNRQPRPRSAVDRASRFPAHYGRGGERPAAARLSKWVSEELGNYGARRDDLAEPGTSQLSSDLHFGCLSPLQVQAVVDGLPGAEPFVRQLCRRDFYMQILAARPETAWSDFVERGGRARIDPVQLEAWCNGMTGVPIVDAAMRQLSGEGFIPNRARMIAASFLTRHLKLDWRLGARHFLEHLVDADVALNNLNWQWMAGRGTGANPNRVLSPTRQARRFDPKGEYVRRYVPELAGLDSSLVHEPWRLIESEFVGLGYPAPVVALDEVGV